MDKLRVRIIVQQEQKLDKRFSILSYNQDRVPIWRVTNRPKAGTPRVKWLNKLEQEENLGFLTRFEERYTKGYHNVVITRYFLIDRLYTLNQLYRKWYRQQYNNKQEDFYIWLNKKVI